MAVQVWCWPYVDRFRKWFGHSGHVALCVDEIFYDFFPAGHEDARLPASKKDRQVPFITRSMLERLESNPTDPVLDSQTVRGMMLTRRTAMLASDMAHEFELGEQFLDQRIRLDEVTGLFVPGTDDLLPTGCVYRVATKPEDTNRLREHLKRLSRQDLKYHVARYNCTHFVRHVLQACEILDLRGDSWKPDSRHPGKWRPDRFQQLLDNNLGPSRRFRIARRKPMGPGRKDGGSYYWKEWKPSEEMATAANLEEGGE